MRWPNGVCCPACGNQKISRTHAKGRLGKVRLLYQRTQKACRYQFSTTTGTIFHDSHLPLSKFAIEQMVQADRTDRKFPRGHLRESTPGCSRN
ncbi:MAG: transposase [Acidobacteriia bacterium]|nr:transposase [Terriglobia bacterium]